MKYEICSDENKGKEIINNVGLNNYKFINLYLKKNFTNNNNS